METTWCSRLTWVGCQVPGFCLKHLRTGDFKQSAWDPFGWQPLRRKNLPEDLKQLLLAWTRIRCTGCTGWETEPDHSKSVVTATTSRSRAIQQNRWWLCSATSQDAVWKPVFVDHQVCVRQISWSHALENIIKAKAIERALSKFFTLIGLPGSIQDSNFMSDIF